MMTSRRLSILLAVCADLHPGDAARCRAGRGSAADGRQSGAGGSRPAAGSGRQDARSPYRPIWTGYLTATHAPLGIFWKRHEALADRRALWQAEGDMLTTPCQSHTIILTDETAQLFSPFYAGGASVKAQRVRADDMFERDCAAGAITCSPCRWSRTGRTTLSHGRGGSSLQ